MLRMMTATTFIGLQTNTLILLASIPIREDGLID